MHRRRMLTLSAAALGSAGCLGVDTEDDTQPSPTRGAPSTAGSNWVPTATPERTPTRPPSRVGGSLHGRAYRLDGDYDLLRRSDTTWLHAFFDVRRLYEADVDPRDDPSVAALRRASRDAGVRLIVSLQWNFTGVFGELEGQRLPAAGSTRERDLVAYASSLLAAIEQPVDAVVLGNEPIWETLDTDFQGDEGRLIPFTRTLKDHLVATYDRGDPRLLVGAFNRLYDDPVRTEYQAFHRRLFAFARDDPDIDGIDLHIHYSAIAQAEEMLRIARARFPDGLVTATEFSPVWRYNQHKDAPITSFPDGSRFAHRYDIENDTTVTEYLEAAKDDRLAPHEAADFFDMMPWYNVTFVEDMHDLLAQYNVAVGTFCFLVEDDVHNVDWTDAWLPFPINCLFQPALIDSEDGAHPFYLEDYRDRA